MKTNLALFRTVMAALVAAAFAWPVQAQVPRPGAPEVPGYWTQVSANCNAVGQSVAAREGGQLLRAVAADQGGRTVCVITYTVPSRDGKPPRRVETTVNAG
jgi:hypothetical protein